MDKNLLLKILKNKNNQRLILIVIIGLIFISFFGEGQKVREEVQNEITIKTEEERLTEILSDIDMAGEVSVMITYYGTNEKNIAYETKKNISSVSESESYDEKAVMTTARLWLLTKYTPASRVLS